jgi:rare lipoprotein A
MMQQGRKRRMHVACSRALGVIKAGLCLVLLLVVQSCGSSPSPHPHFKVGSPYEIGGRWYHPEMVTAYEANGIASWYGEDYHGRLTSNGEVYDMNAFTAAHPTLPLPSLVRVTNLENGRSIVLRVNDRGPFVDGRVIDLSRAAARTLGFEHQGLASVHVLYLGLAPMDEAIVALGQGPRAWDSSAVLLANSPCYRTVSRTC